MADKAVTSEKIGFDPLIFGRTIVRDLFPGGSIFRPVVPDLRHLGIMDRADVRLNVDFSFASREMQRSIAQQESVRQLISGTIGSMRDFYGIPTLLEPEITVGIISPKHYREFGLHYNAGINFGDGQRRGLDIAIRGEIMAGASLFDRMSIVAHEGLHDHVFFGRETVRSEDGDVLGPEETVTIGSEARGFHPFTEGVNEFATSYFLANSFRTSGLYKTAAGAGTLANLAGKGQGYFYNSYQPLALMAETLLRSLGYLSEAGSGIEDRALMQEAVLNREGFGQVLGARLAPNEMVAVPMTGRINAFFGGDKVTSLINRLTTEEARANMGDLGTLGKLDMMLHLYAGTGYDWLQRGVLETITAGDAERKAFAGRLAEMSAEKSKLTVDAYHILGLEPGASLRDITAAYRKLARKWHPDINKEPNAGEMFIKIGDAYNLLTGAN